jgi:hypothetical protein
MDEHAAKAITALPEWHDASMKTDTHTLHEFDESFGN